MPLTLGQYVARYAVRHDIDASTVAYLRVAVQVFDRWHERPVELADLDDDLVSLFLRDSQRRGLSPYTVKSRRAAILLLWRAAWREKLVAAAPIDVRKIRCPETLRTTWTEGEIVRLVVSCHTLRGYFTATGIQRGAYYSSLVMAAWDSGLRLCDLLRLRRDAIDADGTVRLVQHKTGKAHVAWLTARTMQEIEGIFPPTRELVWPLWARREQFYKLFRRVLGASGLSGSFRKLRRSSGTAVDAIQPGTGWQHLGNTPETARRWYINPAVYASRPRPPALFPAK
jgi:integrase